MENIRCYHVIIREYDEDKKFQDTWENVELNYVSKITWDEVAKTALHNLPIIEGRTREVIGISLIDPKDLCKIDYLPANPY
jgi:hypothetical protein